LDLLKTESGGDWFIIDGVLFMMKKKAKVKANYTSSSLDPLKFSKDEAQSGWAPTGYLEITDDSAMAKQDYDATELTVRAGDELTVLGEEGGWCWCSFREDEKGWVPTENLEFPE
jgi:hypothetical protein